MSNQDIGTSDTDNTENDQAEAATKTYTQKEVDDMAARLKSSLTKKLLKPYEDLGDPEELRALRKQAEKQQTELAMKRGDFEKVLQEQAAKKDAEIAARDRIISEYKIDLPLVNAAAQFKSVNPEQVRSLLKSQTRLNAEGEVEVVDAKGIVKYNGKGTAYTVDELVKEFLDANPHFVQPTPSTTNTKSSHTVDGGTKIDISKLDLSRAEHRKIYAEAKKRGEV